MNVTQKELQELLDKHKRWLSNEEGGEYADLGGLDLTGADFSRADFNGSCLYRTTITLSNDNIDALSIVLKDKFGASDKAQS